MRPIVAKSKNSGARHLNVPETKTGAAVFFDLDGDGKITNFEKDAQRDESGRPHYITSDDGTVELPDRYVGLAFVADVDGAYDTDTGERLVGEFYSFKGGDGAIAIPITDLIMTYLKEVVDGRIKEAKAVKGGKPIATPKDIETTEDTDYEFPNTLAELTELFGFLDLFGNSDREASSFKGVYIKLDGLRVISFEGINMKKLCFLKLWNTNWHYGIVQNCFIRGDTPCWILIPLPSL